jgi:hypothetical protein
MTRDETTKTSPFLTHIQAVLESSPTTPFTFFVHIPKLLKLKNNSELKNQEQRNLKFCNHTPKPVE